MGYGRRRTSAGARYGSRREVTDDGVRRYFRSILFVENPFCFTAAMRLSLVATLIPSALAANFTLSSTLGDHAVLQNPAVLWGARPACGPLRCTAPAPPGQRCCRCRCAALPHHIGRRDARSPPHTPIRYWHTGRHGHRHRQHHRPPALRQGRPRRRLAAPDPRAARILHPAHLHPLLLWR